MNIVVYGHGDKSELGFPTDTSIDEYIAGGVFREEQGRYRYTQRKSADIVVLSRDGMAHGHFVIASMEEPSSADLEAYPKTAQVYLVAKSFKYNTPVRLSSLGVTGYQFGKTLSQREFDEILEHAAGTTSYSS